jgi:lysophospholipase L1-like esterase
VPAGVDSGEASAQNRSTMRRRILVLAVVAVAAMAAPSAASAESAVTGYPSYLAAAGDSITRAYDADSVYPPGERLQYSWANGTSSTVDSIYLRLLAANPAISGQVANDAATGAKMIDLQGQLQNAVTQHAQEVVILMGANDVCTSTEAAMTPVSTFKSEFASAMTTLSHGLPDARIYVLSIPSVYRLWQVLHTNPSAQFVWGYAGICQSMLANPTSTAQADVDRRAAVLKREKQFNTQLQNVCALYVHCRFDGDVVFNYPYTASDANTLDYFHPSITGQTTLASVAWAHGFDFTDVTPPVSTATFTPVTGGASVSISATDAAGVSGIEYKIGSGFYKRYAGPVTVATGKTITWRAVDVNGNIEATHSHTV